MAINKGVAPPDISTEVGRFRALVGDLSYTELDPPEAGFGNYTLFSDFEIEVFLASSGSLEGAAALAYTQLAGSAALESKTVKDFDLSVDLSKKATDLRLIAAMWQDKADAAAVDVFELFDVNIRDSNCTPELAARSYGGDCGFRFF